MTLTQYSMTLPDASTRMIHGEGTRVMLSKAHPGAMFVQQVGTIKSLTTEVIPTDPPFAEPQEPIEDSVLDAMEAGNPPIDLELRNMEQLKELAKPAGVKPGKLRKAELIKALRAAGVAG